MQFAIINLLLIKLSQGGIVMIGEVIIEVDVENLVEETGKSELGMTCSF